LVTQVSELEAKVVELNQKLSDLNVAKGKELGDLNRLIDECADDKLQTARRDKSVINVSHTFIYFVLSPPNTSTCHLKA